MVISNVHVYGLENAVRGSKFPMAVDIEKLMDKNTFNERMEAMLDGIKSTPLADGATKIYYPGEIEKDKMAACLEAGVVDVDDDTMAAFEACEAELGLR